MREGEYIGTFRRYECPYCNEYNLVCFGNEEDPTGYTPSTCRCFSCETVFSLGTSDECMDEEFAEDGKYFDELEQNEY